jgi:hypothetical protein
MYKCLSAFWYILNLHIQFSLFSIVIDTALSIETILFAPNVNSL